MFIAKKIKRIQQFLTENRHDGLVLVNDGHESNDDLLYHLLHKVLERGLLIIPKRGRPLLYAIPFEVNQLAKTYPLLRVEPWPADFAHIFTHTIMESVHTLAFRPTGLPFSLWKKLQKNPDVLLIEWNDDNHIISIKEPEEIQLLREACHYTDRCFRALILSWKSFRTETDAARFIETWFTERGLESSFPPIIASGPHAADPHHEPEATPLLPGFCVIDMGVRFKGYCSDMTRTIFIGRPTASDLARYRLLFNAQTLALNKVQAGIDTATIDDTCRRALSPLNKECIHSLGHGLGTAVHEWPRISANPSTILEPGMVITIEPGIYRPGSYGLRLEDDVVVEESGVTILTKTTKRLIRIGS